MTSSSQISDRSDHVIVLCSFVSIFTVSVASPSRISHLYLPAFPSFDASTLIALSALSNLPPSSLYFLPRARFCSPFFPIWKLLRTDIRDGDARLSQQFEMASVTPSQSASQVVNNHNRASVPLGQRYSSQFDNVEEQDGTPSETDSEEDYRRAFVEPRMNLPAPHHLGVASDTQDLFMPQSTGVTKASKNGRTSSTRNAAPPPPSKDTPPPVPMPAVPTAPRLDVNAARNFGHIPTAPPAQRGAADDSSDDESRQPRASAAGWGARPSRSSFQGVRSPSRLSSDGGSPSKLKRRDTLLGKVGKLFKTDIRESGAPERPGWDTRTGSRLESQENERKRFSQLRRTEPDSSDEEPDKRELIRHVNNPRPLWGRDTSSDVGVKGKLSKVPSIARITPGPMSLRAQREEDDKLAAIRASVVGNGIAGSGSKPALASGAASIASTGTKKKKKKAAKAGSEIGTAPTRPAGSAAPAPPTKVVVPGDASAGVRSAASISASTRPSLSRSSTLQSTGGKKKKRASLMGTGMVSSSTGNLNAFSPHESKYATASWINKPASQMTAYEAVANAGIVPKAPASGSADQAKPSTPATVGASPSAPASKPLTKVAGTTPESAAATQTQRPPSVQSSASKAQPLKPALKTPSLSRATSNASSHSPSKTAGTGPGKSALRNETTASLVPSLAPPKMEPIPIAPAPVTAAPLPSAPSEPIVIPDQATAPRSVLSLDEDKRFDGTGSLDVRLDAKDESPVKAKAAPTTEAKKADTPRVQMPKLDMPSSEPFQVDIDGLSKRRGSAVTDSSTNEERLLTPEAEKAYKVFIEQNPTPSQPKVLGSTTPEGVTRLTDRKVKLNPSRVYGTGAPELSDTSSEEGSTINVRQSQEAQVAASAQAAADVQSSIALSEPTSGLDSTLKDLGATETTAAADAEANKPAPLLSVGEPSGAASDVSASGVARRKSVRMAPDVKLPPDTPLSEDFATPRGNEYGGQDPIAATSAGVSSRIAPPPAAPAKPKKEGPIDLGASERNDGGWSSRIRADVDADSSSDEDGDGNAYTLARQAFGSASKSWGEATGSKVKSKKASSEVGAGKATTGAASIRSTTSKKKGGKQRAAASSLFEGKTGATQSSSASVISAPPPPTLYTATAPAPISGSSLVEVKAPGIATPVQLERPRTPPTVGAERTVIEPTSPPSMTSSPKKGFFNRFKKLR